MDTSQYFFRTVIFSQQGNQTSLVDINDPDMEALAFEPWLGIVISMADGQHTVRDLIDFVANRYADEPPDELQRTLESAIGRLTETTAVKLTAEPVELPYYLSLPVERLDLARARQLLAEDSAAPN